MKETRKTVDVGELIDRASNPDTRAGLMLLLSISNSLASIDQELREFSTTFLKGGGELARIIETARSAQNRWRWPAETLDKLSDIKESPTKQ